MRTIAYIKGQREWLASQAGILVLINLILLTSTPLAKSLGEIFYLDLLVISVAGAGYFFQAAGYSMFIGLGLAALQFVVVRRYSRRELLGFGRFWY